MIYHCNVNIALQKMTKKKQSGVLTTAAITWIRRKENSKVFFEIMEAWDINIYSMQRWLRENRNPKLSRPTTIEIIERHNPGKIKIINQ